jgi:glucosamine--fructose-6-phosphate aminotransferase (isomerizing)
VAGSRSAADIAEQPEILGALLERNADELDHARELIRGRSLVRLAGVGSSKHAAGYGSLALELLADTPAVVLPAPGATVEQPRPRRDHPLIVLSQSGATPSLLDLARRAADAGVAIVAVTNTPGSSLEDVASVTLRCAAGPERVIAATKSVSAQMLLLRALGAEPSSAQIASLARTLNVTLELDVEGATHDTPPSGVVCAGFAGEWIADEIALKFAEMCGLPVTSESVVEHFHGPRAAHAPTLAFLDPDDPNSKELASHERVTTVGPDNGFDVSTPSTGEASLDALVTLVCGQRIAHAWALALGTDPDADRGLSKVTPTH